jgi:hypothetical protein
MEGGSTYSSEAPSFVPIEAVLVAQPVADFTKWDLYAFPMSAPSAPDRLSLGAFIFFIFWCLFLLFQTKETKVKTKLHGDLQKVQPK